MVELNNNLKTFASIIGILEVIFFAIVIITLATFFYEAKKVNIINALEDDNIKSKIKIDIDKYNKINNKNFTFEEYIATQSKKNKISNKISLLITFFLSIIVVIIIVFSNIVKYRGQQFWIGEKAMLVIQSESMATVHKNNTYLLDEKGKSNFEDRIPKYSLITITNNADSIENIQQYDVVAFKMFLDSEESYITVVHRVIEIDYDEEGNKLYTFRGDANPNSMVGEFKVKREMIVGVYKSKTFTGYKSVPLGCFICYLQSSLGYVILIIATILVLIYFTLMDKLMKTYNERYYILLSQNNRDEIVDKNNINENILVKNEEIEKCQHKIDK